MESTNTKQKISLKVYVWLKTNQKTSKAILEGFFSPQ